jgi:hypothetical protein
MTFEELGDAIREQLRGNPNFAVIERTTERRDTCKCAECNKTIRRGGTGIRFELCRDCSEPGTDAR